MPFVLWGMRNKENITANGICGTTPKSNDGVFSNILNIRKKGTLTQNIIDEATRTSTKNCPI